jgi:hypothetical protein
MNFTKEESLYNSGMRVVISKKSEGYKTYKGGDKICYRKSKHIRKKHFDPAMCQYYYQLSFTYTFTRSSDKVFFAYCYPYTFSMLQRFLKEISLIRAIESSKSKDVRGKL